MSLLCMPLIVTNLGSEMLYILDQRLKAQAIPPDKAAKVLNDVTKSACARTEWLAMHMPACWKLWGRQGSLDRLQTAEARPHGTASRRWHA